jgi:hypothetical protein
MDFPLQSEREGPRGTEVWCPTLRIARKLFDLQVRAHDFELRIDSHRELEQRIGIAYLLSDEYRDLLRMGYSRMTAYIPQAPCSLTFCRNSVGSVSRFGFRKNSTILVILRSATEVKNAMPVAVLLN